MTVRQVRRWGIGSSHGTTSHFEQTHAGPMPRGDLRPAVATRDGATVGGVWLVVRLSRNRDSPGRTNLKSHPLACHS